MATDNSTDDTSLDAFFDAANASSGENLLRAAEQIRGAAPVDDDVLDEEVLQFATKALNARKNVGKSTPRGASQPPTPLPPPPLPPSPTLPPTSPAAPAKENDPPIVPIAPIPEEDAGGGEEGLEIGENLDGKFIAFDPSTIPGVSSDDPFVLVPANIHSLVPWWGWATIVSGLVVFIAGVVLLPGISLNRMAARLGDKNEATAQQAMRQLVVKGDERTVRKLFDMASSSNEGLTARLRAVDTMSLIDRVPEVDKALLRLELSNNTHSQVREAAIAARKQREAYRTRQNR